jgi:hypothetical protein
MKKLSGVILAAFVLILVGTAMSQSLADQAKAAQQQQKKAAARVYTEDDLPSVPESRMAEESHAAEATAANAEAAKDAPAADATSAAGDADKKDDSGASEDEAATKEQQAKDKEAAEADAKEWKSKVDDQQQQINALEKEVDLMQRENKLRQASYYGDAGNQLRDQKKWADEQRQYQTDLEAKQKALAEAKEKMDDTREQARKSGISESKLQ